MLLVAISFNFAILASWRELFILNERKSGRTALIVL